MGEDVVDFGMPRDRGRFPVAAMDEDRVVASLAEKLATLVREVAQELSAFQPETTSGSRITGPEPSSSSANARFASRTRDTASSRFARASSSVSP